MKTIILRFIRMSIMILIMVLMTSGCSGRNLSDAMLELDQTQNMGSIVVRVEKMFGNSEVANIVLKVEIPEELSMNGLMDDFSVNGNFDGGFIYDCVDIDYENRTQTYVLTVFDEKKIIGKTINVKLNGYRSTEDVMQTLIKDDCEFKLKVKYKDFAEEYLVENSTSELKLQIMPGAMILQANDSSSEIQDLSVMLEDGRIIDGKLLKHCEDAIYITDTNYVYLLFDEYIDPGFVKSVMINGEEFVLVVE